MTKVEILDKLQNISDNNYEVDDMSDSEINELKRAAEILDLQINKLRLQYEVENLKEIIQKDINLKEEAEK